MGHRQRNQREQSTASGEKENEIEMITTKKTTSSISDPRRKSNISSNRSGAEQKQRKNKRVKQKIDKKIIVVTSSPLKCREIKLFSTFQQGIIS